MQPILANTRSERAIPLGCLLGYRLPAPEAILAPQLAIPLIGANVPATT